MALQTSAIKNILAAAYIGAALYAEIATTAPGSSAGTAAGSRVAISWGSASAGVVTGTVTLSVAGGVTVVGINLWSAITSGTYYDGGSVTSQAFATSGTYVLTITFTES